MKQVWTVSCKLNIVAEQVYKVEDTLKAFCDACEYLNKAVPEKLTNEFAIQSLVYHDVRVYYRLSSQLAIHACCRVAGNRKTAKKDANRLKSLLLLASPTT